jgi:hypothetical protein
MYRFCTPGLILIGVVDSQVKAVAVAVKDNTMVASSRNPIISFRDSMISTPVVLNTVERLYSKTIDSRGTAGFGVAMYFNLFVFGI